jgi:hypothetical protein
LAHCHLKLHFGVTQYLECKGFVTSNLIHLLKVNKTIQYKLLHELVANYLENTGEDEPDDDELFDDQGHLYKTFLTSVMILQIS